MDINKNSFTFVFATIMVIIVAALLSVAYIQLKPFQDKNIELEKQQNILRSVGVEAFIIAKNNAKHLINKEDAVSINKNDTIFLKKDDVVEFLDTNGKYNEIEDKIIVSRELSSFLYSRFIKEQIILNYAGEMQKGNAFEVDLAKEIKKDALEQALPVYIAEVKGEKKYIIPLRGKGLWGPIWGFISFNADLNTVFAAVFDHKGETPGLGAEINTPLFQTPFSGKTILDEEEFVSIIVQKGGAKGDIHKVDGISGGTITSNGVSDMLSERLNMYLPYFNKIRLEK